MACSTSCALPPPGGRTRHRRGQRAARPAGRPARLRHRRADPRRPRAQLDPHPHQQPEEDPRARGLRALGHRQIPIESRPTRRTSPTCGPSGRSWATRCTTRVSTSTPRCCAASAASRPIDGRRRATRSSSRASRGARRAPRAGRSAVFEADHEVDGRDLRRTRGLELPSAALYAAQTGRFRGVACLGAVIRGETDHYQHVCAAAAHGIAEVTLRTGVPCGFGVLTVDTAEQALARSGGGKRDSGADAARAVLALAEIRERLASGRLPAWPRYVTRAQRAPRSATRAATRWSRRAGASTRTCRRCGSSRTARPGGSTSARAASRRGRSPRRHSRRRGRG